MGTELERPPQVRVGQWWWQGTGPCFIVDGLMDRGEVSTAEASYKGSEAESQTVVLARWRATEGGLNREEQKVPVEALLLDSSWRLAPDDVVERAMDAMRMGGVSPHRIEVQEVQEFDGDAVSSPPMHLGAPEQAPLSRVLAVGWRRRARGLRERAKVFESAASANRVLADELDHLADDQELYRH